MYTHRGAYLNALGENVTAGHRADTVYLWTLPMFHCNGWCHLWAIVAAGGTQVCLPAVRPEEIVASDRRGGRHAPAAARRPCSPCSSTRPRPTRSRTAWWS